MATRGVEPITLPWKRPEKGVSAAELGASFRVEQREDGWHCTVRVGRRAEVLATGLRRLRDAQCRAEAHAATLPEVAAALAKMKAEAAKEPAPVRAVKMKAEAAKAAAKEPREAPVRRTVPTFEPISDGCICGKIEGGTWIADPAGKVSVPAGTAPEVAQEICRVAARHYAAQRSKTATTLERPRAAAKAASRTAAKRKQAAEVEAPEAATATPRRAGKGKRGKGRNRAARKRLAAKLAGKPMANAPTKSWATRAAKVEAENAAATAKTATAKTTAKSTAKKTTAKPTAKKTTAKSTAKAAKTTARTAVEVTAKATARTGKRSGRPRDAGKKEPPATQAEKVEKPMGKKSGKAASKSECGCMTWTEAEGKTRGEAKHGAFVIEPEGKKHALYFYDPAGQSRHLQSGEASKLRKVAEEMAARGQPTTRAASAGDDAALLKMFMAGAMEEET